MATFHPSGCHRSFASRVIDAVCLIAMVVLSLSLSLEFSIGAGQHLQLHDCVHLSGVDEMFTIAT